MSLEWFDRVCEELPDHLESICNKYDEEGHMTVDRAAKHPRIEFFVETEDIDRDYFCTLLFDPHNEEFYIESFDLDLGQTSKTVLSDIEDIIDVVHESLHDYLNEDFELELDDEFDDDEFDDDEFDEYTEIESYSDDFYEDIEVDWTTPEVTAYAYEDEVEVTYQFGIVEDTGDGILRRINRIVTTEDELIEDESAFIFGKEEASTIIAMIASHMDSLSEMDR